MVFLAWANLVSTSMCELRDVSCDTQEPVVRSTCMLPLFRNNSKCTAVHVRDAKLVQLNKCNHSSVFPEW